VFFFFFFPKVIGLSPTPVVVFHFWKEG